MNANKTLELAALALCEHRREEPSGYVTVWRWRGTSVEPETKTYLEIAREDAKAVLDAAVPGLLAGAVAVVPVDYNEGL